MVIPSDPAPISDLLREDVRKNGQPAPEARGRGQSAKNAGATNLPPGALLSTFLRTYENELIGRGLLVPPSTHYAPLWFLVETERNVFLWRNGLSVCDADEYEFWIDPARIVEKRLLQLENPEIGNPFLSSSIELAEASTTSPDARRQAHEEEERYLNDFLELLHRGAPHAHALSEVLSIVSTSPGKARPTRVLLPLGRVGRCR